MAPTRIVQFPITVTRPVTSRISGYLTDGDHEVTHDLRAEVTDLGDNESPCVIWVDAAHVADLELDAEELTGAEEAAIREYDRIAGLAKSASPATAQIRTVA